MENDYKNKSPINRSFTFHSPDEEEKSFKMDAYEILTSLACNWESRLKSMVIDPEELWWAACEETEQDLNIGFEDTIDGEFENHVEASQDLAELGMIKFLCGRQGIKLPPMVLAQINRRDALIDKHLKDFPK